MFGSIILILDLEFHNIPNIISDDFFEVIQTIQYRNTDMHVCVIAGIVGLCLIPEIYEYAERSGHAIHLHCGSRGVVKGVNWESNQITMIRIRPALHINRNGQR